MVMQVYAAQIAIADPQPGDVIYFEDAFGLYATTGTIVSRADNPVYSLLYLDTPNGASPWAVAGWANFLKRENYLVEVEVMGFIPKTNVTKSFGRLRVTPDIRGVGRLDVRTFLNGYIEKTNSATYPSGQRNEKDKLCWGSFTLNMVEKWNLATGSIDTGTPVSLVDTNKYYFIDGVKQLLEQYGQNFLDKVIFAENGVIAPRTVPAKWLTEGERVRWWPTFPFDVSVIMQEDLIGADMTYEDEMFNGAMGTLGTRDETLHKPSQGGVVRVNPKTGYNASTEFMDMWLEVGGLPSTSYYEDDMVLDGYFTEETPSVTGYVFQATQKLRIKVESNYCGTVYLAWKNRVSGWNYWLFDERVEKTIATKTEGFYGVEPDNIETGIARIMKTGTSSRTKFKIGTAFELADVGVLSSLEESPLVLMLVDNIPGSYKWIAVTMLNKGMKLPYGDSSGEAEFEFELPETYTVFN